MLSQVAEHAPSLVLNFTSPGFLAGMAALRAAIPAKNPGEERSEEHTEEKKNDLWEALSGSLSIT